MSTFAMKGGRPFWFAASKLPSGRAGAKFSGFGYSGILVSEMRNGVPGFTIMTDSGPTPVQTVVNDRPVGPAVVQQPIPVVPPPVAPDPLVSIEPVPELPPYIDQFGPKGRAILSGIVPGSQAWAAKFPRSDGSELTPIELALVSGLRPGTAEWLARFPRGGGVTVPSPAVQPPVVARKPILPPQPATMPDLVDAPGEPEVGGWLGDLLELDVWVNENILGGRPGETISARPDLPEWLGGILDTIDPGHTAAAQTNSPYTVPCTDALVNFLYRENRRRHRC